MKLVIITGGSKGIGKSLVKRFCEEKYSVVSISRTKLDFSHRFFLTQFFIDITSFEKVEKVFKKIDDLVSKSDLKQIFLINNAGRIGEIRKVENLSSSDITKTIDLNLSAPIILSSLFLSILKPKAKSSRIINISSGASVSPYYGWMAYCCSKAGVEMMTKTISIEQSEDTFFKSLSIKPGVVDTQMQDKIRQSSRQDFKDVDKFIQLKKQRRLYSADYSAEKIFKIIDRDSYESGDSIDIRN